MLRCFREWELTLRVLCLFLELLNHPMASFPALPLSPWAVSSSLFSASCRHRWCCCCCRGFSSSIIIRFSSIRLGPPWEWWVSSHPLSFNLFFVLSLSVVRWWCLAFLWMGIERLCLCGLSLELRNHPPFRSLAFRGIEWLGFSICTVLWVSVCCYWWFVILYMGIGCGSEAEMWDRRYVCRISSLKICLLLHTCGIVDGLELMVRVMMWVIMRVMGGVMEDGCYLGAR